MTTDQDPTWTRRSNVLHQVNVSIRYHRYRQRFFDLLDKGTKALTVLFGASLLSTYVKELLPIVSALISGLGLLALVYGYGDRKQTHSKLADDFTALKVTIVAAGEFDLQPEMVDAWCAEMERINMKEPPTLYTLVDRCEYEQYLAVGVQPPRSVPRWKRPLSHFFSMART